MLYVENYSRYNVTTKLMMDRWMDEQSDSRIKIEIITMKTLNYHVTISIQTYTQTK